MHEVNFRICFCGMSEETFTEQIMIYQPNSDISWKFTLKSLQKSGLLTVGSLIDSIKKDESLREGLGEWGYDNFRVETVYVQYQDYLLGLQEDKPLSDISRYLNLDHLNFVYFIVGGASIHNETAYKFTIHPDEKIHKNMPHVHVSKAGVEIRYSLETLQPIDPLKNPHQRDNKKIIVPFLEKHQEEFLQLWNHYTNGYTVPTYAEDMKQFYAES